MQWTKKIHQEWKEFTILLKEIPSYVLVLFVASLLIMNLLANKSIDCGTPYLALDCGIFVSWISFLTLDALTKHFGAKAANEVSLFGIVFSLFFSLIFYLASLVPGVWGESFIEGSEDIINNALNHTFGGTWYVLLGSTTAFLASAFINNGVNSLLAPLFRKKPNSRVAFFVRSYVSTSIAQFCDNLIFAFMVSYLFFSWTPLQCVTCALTGMGVELLLEILFSFYGYHLTEKWRKEEIGKAYFAYRMEKEKEYESDHHGN